MSQSTSNGAIKKISYQAALDCYKQGEKAVSEGKIKQAITHYRQATQLNPKFSWAYHKLGDNLSEIKRWKPAIAAYRQAIELKSDFFWSHHNLGNALTQIGNWNQAIQAYLQAIQIQSDFCWSYYGLGDALSQKQRWRQAVEAYIQAEKLQQNLPGLIQRLGQVFYQQAHADLPRVIQEYCDGLSGSNVKPKSGTHYDFSPQDLEIYVNLAQALAEEEYYIGSIILFKIALKIQPQNPKILQQLQQVKQKQTQLDQQIIVASQAAKSSPNSYQAHYELGVILSRQQQWDQAIAAYFKAIELYPDQPAWVYQGLWDILLQQGRLEEAIELYRQAIHQHPDSVWCYVNLGEMLTRQGKLEEAIRYYQMAADRRIQQFYPDWANQRDQLIPVKQPDFMIIGTQKGGTTSLYNYLVKHPQIVPSLVKEIQFWPHKYERGIEWYLAHFLPRLEGNYLTGEATPGYLDWQGVAENVFKEFPQTKLIILLRDPVDRGISHYYHWVSLKWESRPLKTAFEAELEQVQQLQGNSWNQPNSYLARGVYIEFIKGWMDIFPQEQILILKSEDLYLQPAQVLTQVFQFLGLSDYSLQEYKPYNSRTYPQVEEAMMDRLRDYFKPHNQALESFLNRKLGWDR